MKKLLYVTSFAFVMFAGQAFAVSDAEIGKAIFKKGLGTGCYGCHAATSSPQIKELIKSGDLTKAQLATALKEGSSKKTMPKDAIGDILNKVKIKDKETDKKGSLKELGVTEEQAINALYNYIKDDVK